MEELDVAKQPRVLARRVGQRAAEQRAQKDAHVPAESEPAKGQRLGARGRDLGQHGPNGDDRAGKDAREAPEQDHLPDGGGHAEDGGGDGDADEAGHEDGLAAQGVGGAAPKDHDEGLGQREERLDQAAVEAHVGVGEVPVVLDHLVHVGEDGEEGHGLDHAREAEPKDLPFGEGAVIIIIFFFFFVIVVVVVVVVVVVIVIVIVVAISCVVGGGAGYERVGGGCNVLGGQQWRLFRRDVHDERVVLSLAHLGL